MPGAISRAFLRSLRGGTSTTALVGDRVGDLAEGLFQTIDARPAQRSHLLRQYRSVVMIQSQQQDLVAE